jgi:hypothetical protein
MSDDCDLLSVFENITNNCSNDLQVARDQCAIVCVISIMKGIDLCGGYLFNTGLLTQLKDLVKWCVYKKYDSH